MTQRKQSLEHADFVAIREKARVNISKPAIEAKVSFAANDVYRFCRGKKAAFAWSGGKDSVVLKLIADFAGIEESVLGICDLEYPAFLAWATANMPHRLEVINTGLDLDWLAANPAMLFPQNAGLAAQWFAKVQHAAQRRYYKAHRLDVIMVGRRRSDGNFVGRDGQNFYECDGVTRYSPLADWSHAEIFAAIDHYGLKLPPFYDWPRGYRCGTHPWAARQWCKGVGHGWHEVHQIDPSIVHHAADRIPSAAMYLERA
jgi:hypothetical protein